MVRPADLPIRGEGLPPPPRFAHVGCVHTKKQGRRNKHESLFFRYRPTMFAVSGQRLPVLMKLIVPGIRHIRRPGLWSGAAWR